MDGPARRQSGRPANPSAIGQRRSDGGGVPPGWDDPQRRAGQRVPRQQAPTTFYPPGQRGAPGPGAPGARTVAAPAPSGAPGRARSGQTGQVGGAPRPRPPAGPVPPGGYPPGRRPPGPYAQSAPGATRQRGATARRPRQALGAGSRRVVRRLDVVSVAKVSLVFYLCVMVVMLIAGTVLWNVAAAFGVISIIEKLVRSLFALTSFQLHPLTALAWGSAIAGAFCFIGLLLNVLAAVLYNLIADIVGGLQVVVVSDQDS